MTQTNLLNGLLSNCEAFDKWLKAWFEKARTRDEDQWSERDRLAAAWDAGVRAALGINATPEEMRAHADEVDRLNGEPKEVTP